MADYNPYWFDPNNLPPEVMQQQINQMQPLMGQMPQQMLGAPQMPMTIQVPDIQYSDAMKKQARGQGFMEAGLNLLANMKPTALPQSPLANIGQAGLAGLQSYQGNLNNKMAQALEYAKMQKYLQGTPRGLSFDTFVDKSNKNWRIGYDPLTGKEVSRTEQGEGKPASTSTQINPVTRIRQEFNNLPEIKYYKDIYNKSLVMDKAMEEAKTTNNFVAVDQALINMYNKMMDPQSVVRESEYIRTPQDMALKNRMVAAVSRLGKGGRLTPEDRQAIYIMASRFKESARGYYDQRSEEYKQLALSSGINPDLIVLPEKNVLPRPKAGQPPEKKSKFTILKVE